MKRTLFLLLPLIALLAAPLHAAQQTTQGEYILLVGGPSLMQWEKYKAQPHDHWWANFVRAARIRTEQIREEAGPDAKITWLVYKQGYLDRAAQEHMDLISFIDSVRDKFNLNLVWFHNGDDVINYLNSGQPRSQMKIADFEFFGHSNKACFMFDYSSAVDSSAKSFLHESQLAQIHRGIFWRNAVIKSWGCHTGESMGQKFHAATGMHMIGALGKTQFMMDELPILTSPGGRWVSE
jgi:hypothetical protein